MAEQFPFDQGNQLLAESPAHLLTARSPDGKRMIVTIRTQTTTLTVMLDKPYGLAWAKNIAETAAGMPDPSVNGARRGRSLGRGAPGSAARPGLRAAPACGANPPSGRRDRLGRGGAAERRGDEGAVGCPPADQPDPHRREAGRARRGGRA
jgi:hypothetical protein